MSMLVGKENRLEKLIFPKNKGFLHTIFIILPWRGGRRKKKGCRKIYETEKWKGSILNLIGLKNAERNQTL